jgi:DNA-directed RNA polymerase subunit M/transcription elongation factor TFIIS
MKLFCDYCNTLLGVTTKNNNFYFICGRCSATYKADDNDSLRYEETKGGNLIIFNKILSNASRDPVNLKKYIKCPKCSNNIAKTVLIGKEMRLINVCEKCSFQWIDL